MKKLKKTNNGNGLTILQKKMQLLAENKLSNSVIVEQLMIEMQLLFYLGNVIGMCRVIRDHHGIPTDSLPLPECETVNLEQVVKNIQNDPMQCPSISFRSCIAEAPLLEFISHL
jgi:hypothetical protein